MREFLARRRPSPAMAVAFLALIVALSGTAVALPGRNSVDSGDIRRGAVKNSDLGRNAVTSSKVRDNSLTGADVESLTGADIRGLTGSDIQGLTGADVVDDSLTGGDINEASLGMVPNAAAAANAGAVNGITFTPQVTVAPGDTAPLASKGALTLQLRCIDNGGGDIGFSLEMNSSADGAAADAVTGGDDDELDAADPPMEIATNGGSTTQSFEQASWTALTPGGQRFEGYGFVTSKFNGSSVCAAKAVLFE